MGNEAAIPRSHCDFHNRSVVKLPQEQMGWRIVERCSSIANGVIDNTFRPLGNYCVPIWSRVCLVLIRAWWKFRERTCLAH